MNVFFLILLLPMLFVFGCTSKYEKMLINNIAEVRQFIYVGENNNIKSSFICGSREKEYVANGMATELQDFGVVTFIIPNDIEIDKINAEYVLTIDTKKYNGQLEVNPFDGSLVADIGKIIDKKLNVSAKIIAGEFIEEIKLNLISDDWEIKFLDVIDIVVENYKKEIKSFIKDDVFCGEIYIKMVGEDSGYDWYFNMISIDGNSLSLIISKDNGNILASNFKDVNKVEKT